VRPVELVFLLRDVLEDRLGFGVEVVVVLHELVGGLSRLAEALENLILEGLLIEGR
jgi:hypothetical protein